MREYYFSIIGVGCNKHVVVLKCDYFPAVEAKSSTTKVCGRLRKNSIPFDSAALAPERPQSPEDRLRRGQESAESRVEAETTKMRGGRTECDSQMAFSSTSSSI